MKELKKMKSDVSIQMRLIEINSHLLGKTHVYSKFRQIGGYLQLYEFHSTACLYVEHPTNGSLQGRNCIKENILNKVQKQSFNSVKGQRNF